jgi:hypothetical protein
VLLVLIKKILSIFGKTDASPSNKNTENNQTFHDKEKEEILNKIKLLEEQQQEILNAQTNNSESEDYTLTEKQLVFALSLIEKLNKNYELGINPSELTIKDLNRLVAYNKYKNVGALVNLEKKGVLKKKVNVSS